MSRDLEAQKNYEHFFFIQNFNIWKAFNFKINNTTSKWSCSKLKNVKLFITYRTL